MTYSQNQLFNISKSVSIPLSNDELRVLQKVARSGGYLVINQEIEELKSAIDSLTKKGIISKTEKLGNQVITAPVELLFELQFDKNEEPKSLIMAFLIRPTSMPKKNCNFK